MVRLLPGIEAPALSRSGRLRDRPLALVPLRPLPRGPRRRCGSLASPLPSVALSTVRWMTCEDRRRGGKETLPHLDTEPS
jgi:hypothetical protein